MYPMSVKKVPMYPIFYPKGTVSPLLWKWYMSSHEHIGQGNLTLDVSWMPPRVDHGSTYPSTFSLAPPGLGRSESEIPSYGSTHQERQLHAIRLERRSGVIQIADPAELARTSPLTLRKGMWYIGDSHILLTVGFYMHVPKVHKISFLKFWGWLKR